MHRLRTLELSIESRDYDFHGMAGKINVWCTKTQISPRLANRISLVFEETTHLLVSFLNKTPQIQAVCDYSQENEEAQWTFQYAGEGLDLTQSDDDLSLAVLKGMAESINHDWEETKPLPNRLHIKIR